MRFGNSGWGFRASEAGPDTRPLLRRLFAVPVAAKVPEVVWVFWVVKVLTTGGGEAASDYLKVYGNFVGGGVEVGLLLLGLGLQFGTRRYRAFAYWFLAYAIAIFGTGVADFLHLDVGSGPAPRFMRCPPAPAPRIAKSAAATP